MTIFEHETESEHKTKNILPTDPEWIPNRSHTEDGCFEARQGIYCTLAKGHSGDHAAHGLGRIIEVWPQEQS